MILARVLVVDVPWPFKDKLPGGGRGAEKHYKVMTLSDIIRMPLPPIADDAVMFFWRVSSMVPEAYEVVRSWGFTAKSEIVWNKTDSSGALSLGMGRIVRGSHETCIVATRGKGIAPLSRVEKTSFLAPRGKHSEKPEAFFHIVERLYPLELWPEAHVELFARKRRKGWIVFGDEVPPEEVEEEEEDAEEVTRPQPPTMTPPQSVELPTAWVGAANNQPGEALVRRRSIPHSIPVTIHANDLVPPPSPNRASWKTVIYNVAADLAASTPSPSNVVGPPAASENLSALVAKLSERGVDVPLIALCSLSPLLRSVTQTFAEQGGDPPTFLEAYVREAF